MLSIGEANKKVKRGNKSKKVLCAFTHYFVMLPLFTSVHKRVFKELKMFKTNKPPRDQGTSDVAKRTILSTDNTEPTQLTG